jgi:hypothetical protein
LELPQEAIYHYLNYDGSVSGPASDEYLLRNIKHQIPIVHIDDLTHREGNPRYHAQTTNVLIKNYHHEHRHTRWLRELSLALRDKNTPIVYNYALISKIYKYQQSVFANYYRWKNIFGTMLGQVNEVAKTSQRQHFIVVQSPKFVPSMTQLNQASLELSQTLVKVFNDPNSYILLELWKWVYADRENSIFSTIDAKHIHLFNFIFQQNGKWFVLNLGKLNSWRIPENEKEQAYYNECVEQVKQKSPALQVAKRLLHMYITAMELQTLTSKPADDSQPVFTQQDEIDIAEQQASDEEDISEQDDADDDIEVQKEVQQPDAKLIKTLNDANVLLNQIQDIEDSDNIDHDTFVQHTLAEEQRIDEALKSLEVIADNFQREVTKAKSQVKEILKDNASQNHDQAIVKLCDKLANDGAISAAEYNRYTRLAQSYKTMVAPDGTSTLEQYINIDPQVLKLDQSKEMVDSPSVIDKSMLRTTLNDFDSKYIKEVLKKDVAGAVMSLQNAGVAVTNYHVKDVEDVLGASELHTIKITPIIGVPSTLRFKLPKVLPDGTFENNAVKYKIRKQKADVPIRKTGPNRVALTSYYGKCFITRARNNSSSYGYWLQNKVMAIAIDSHNESITQPVVANVFDQDLHAPRNYSALATSFKSFTCQGFTFNFDHDEVAATWPIDVITQTERGGNILVAKSLDETYLYLDKYGNLFETNSQEETKSLGTLESFLGIESGNAPVEYVTVGVFGKDIPLGIILGINMGFQSLVEVLGARHRVVPAGQRLNLQPNEYSIAFTDETWIFNKEDQLSTLVLAGFNEYWKSLKQFSVYSFDQRGAYQNLLEMHDMGVRYVREIDLMYQMFIDPITRDLLVEMKEPITFKGLLFRSAQMLIDDRHPDELDPAYMRIKGYERVAGAVYTELVQAVREHNGKLGRTNAQIEMNPFKIWNRISEDPAKSQAQEINPIKQIKEGEAVTFAGTGGRNKRSMTKRTRSYHPNDMGTISESTVDSGDVGINIFTSANPQFTSLRGMSSGFDMKKTGASSLLSTSALLAPGSDTDD